MHFCKEHGGHTHCVLEYFFPKVTLWKWLLRSWGWDHHKAVIFLLKCRHCLVKNEGTSDTITCHTNGESGKTGQFLEKDPSRKSRVRPARLDFDKASFLQDLVGFQAQLP